MEERNKSEKEKIDEKHEFCKNYTGEDAWFGPNNGSHNKELNYIYTHRYGHKQGE